MIGKCSSPLSLPSLSIDPFRPPISTNSFLFLPSRSTDIQHRHRRQLHRFTSHHYMFKGIYNGRQCHAADIPAVLARAWSAGVDRIIVTAASAALAPHMWWQLENVDWTMTGFSFALLKYKRSTLKI
ncbi:hypothetical protein BHE74_00022497 [Ensete ventricosum]|nr:hypothetical protein BHE74_00022497 [Ensete ventricosum]